MWPKRACGPRALILLHDIVSIVCFVFDWRTQRGGHKGGNDGQRTHIEQKGVIGRLRRGPVADQAAEHEDIVVPCHAGGVLLTGRRHRPADAWLGPNKLAYNNAHACQWTTQRGEGGRKGRYRWQSRGCRRSGPRRSSRSHHPAPNGHQSKRSARSSCPQTPRWHVPKASPCPGQTPRSTTPRWLFYLGIRGKRRKIRVPTIIIIKRLAFPLARTCRQLSDVCVQRAVCVLAAKDKQLSSLLFLTPQKKKGFARLPTSPSSQPPRLFAATARLHRNALRSTACLLRPTPTTATRTRAPWATATGPPPRCCCSCYCWGCWGCRGWCRCCCCPLARAPCCRPGCCRRRRCWATRATTPTAPVCVCESCRGGTRLKWGHLFIQNQLNPSVVSHVGLEKIFISSLACICVGESAGISRSSGSAELTEMGRKNKRPSRDQPELGN